MMLYNRIKPALLMPLVLPLALIGTLSACVTSPVAKPDPAELQRALSGTTTPPPLPVDGSGLFVMSPGMREFAREYVPVRGAPSARLRELLSALITIRDIEYSTNANLTAQEAFEKRQANCLAFSSLIVAMADEIGIEARFQEVDLPPSWEGQNSDLLLRLRHVNVVTNVRGRDGYTVVDFSRERSADDFSTRAITHNQAIARFYNNLAVESLLKENYELGRAYVLAALEIEPDLAFVWVNLGLLYRRMNDRERAEISYRQALALEPQNTSALGNLATLHYEYGERTEGARLEAMVKRERERDPFFSYAMAQRAYSRSELDSAVDWLTRALDRRWREHRFHHLMGMIQWQLGQPQHARESMREALNHAKQPDDIRQYREQLAEWDSAISQS